MPELPEVLAHAERLTEEFGGAELAGFRPISFTALKTFQPDPQAAVGSAVIGWRQHGKYLVMETSAVGPAGEPLSFVVHLMQGGRLKPDAKQAAKPRNGIARWSFVDGRALLLTEAGTERKAGVWMVEGDPAPQEPLIGLGPDARAASPERLADALRAEKNTRLHGALRDQRRVAGLGRRLANEICHRAGLSPFAMTAKLTDDEVAAVVAAIDELLAEGLQFERGRSEMSSSADRPGAVHHRAGEACPVCGDVVREVAYRSYTVNYCPTCQTAGKILADNTTSKFLK